MKERSRRDSLKAAFYISQMCRSYCRHRQRWLRRTRPVIRAAASLQFPEIKPMETNDLPAVPMFLPGVSQRRGTISSRPLQPPASTVDIMCVCMRNTHGVWAEEVQPKEETTSCISTNRVGGKSARCVFLLLLLKLSEALSYMITYHITDNLLEIGEGNKRKHQRAKINLTFISPSDPNKTSLLL